MGTAQTQTPSCSRRAIPQPREIGPSRYHGCRPGGDITADVDAIIEQILAATRAKGGRAFQSSRTYSDEPILVRGSQLSSYLPEPIQRVRALAHSPEARAWSDARLFVEQARLMEDYEDDFPYEGEFRSYFPTYQAMTNPQLRGYFTWRTRVREGRVEPTSLSFAFVYLYELINGIGASPGEEAFHAIEGFWRSYRAIDPALDRYVRPWLVDYVVYHGLSPELAAPYLNAAHDRAVQVLAVEEARILEEPPARGRRAAKAKFALDPKREEAVFQALCALSTYRLGESRLFKDDPDALMRVTPVVFDRLVRHYRSGRTQGYVESLFGSRHAMPHLMFASAVFWPGAKHEDCVVRLDDTVTFICQNGFWTCDALHDGGEKSARLGQVLHAVDQRLRTALGHPQPLQDRGDPKYLAQIIDRVVADYLEWRQEHAPRRIEIDLSKLAGIRSTAAVTRDALLVDEEREDAGTPASPEPAGAESAGVGAPATDQTQKDEKDAPLGLSTAELEFVRALLEGRAPAANSMDLLVDAINEKFFDLVGDVVIEFGADGAPTLVEDYVEGVREALS